MTLVSVLMSVRNGERTLSAAIESIRAQTFSEWELVIVDDGSTDGTPALLEAYDDPRIRVLRNDVNRGLAASLNIAFRASRGELIARMDADDVALPHRLARQVEFLASHPEVDVLGSAAILVDGDGREEGITTRPERHEDMAAAILRINPLIHPAVMMRRRVLEELGGYDEHLLRAQDYDLWLRGVSRFRYHNLQEPLLRYRRPDGLTWISSSYSARVIWKNDRSVRGAWYAVRQLVALAVAKLR